MLRKMILTIATCGTIGAAALAPTAASAYRHPGWGWHRGFVVRPAVGPIYAGTPYGGCMVRHFVPTPYGPAVRWVNRCY